jgi:PKD repeat protein
MINRRLILALLTCCIFCGMAGSCLKETPLPVEIDFGYRIEGEYSTTPLTVTIENKTTGADAFEWTFEGGSPATSSDKNPGQVTFTEPGEHRITLRAWNMNLEETREITVRVDPDVTVQFDYQIAVNDFAPADVSVANLTQTEGAGEVTYEWTFEGGQPATSALADPGTVRFDTEGEHKVTLTAFNGSQYFTIEQTVTLKPTLLCNFTMEPVVANNDLEAPLTAVLKNTSRSSLSVRWQCAQGVIGNSTAEETTIYFAGPGTYTVGMTADNLKEQKSATQQITVKPNCGIFTLTDLQFGISQAKNTVGCLFSGAYKRVLKANEITDAQTGAVVDLGFFALNSSFDHCYFFSPDQAEDSGFSAIPGATTTQINNKNANTITARAFGQIATAAGMDAYDFTPGTGTGQGNESDTFALDQLPVFVFFRTQDDRRGIVMIKEAVGSGAGSYVVADIKIEKAIR